MALTAQARGSGNLSTLREAAKSERAAIGALGERGQTAYRYRFELASTLWTLSYRGHDESVLPEAHEHFAAVADSDAASPGLRLSAARVLARIHTALGDHQAALERMEAVVRLLPLAASRGLRRHDREHALKGATAASSQAASAALSAGQPARAVELFEQARGFLLAETMGGRMGPAMLRQAGAHDLVGELERLLAEFDALDTAPLTGAEPRMSFETGAFSRWETSREIAVRQRVASGAWDDLLARIRARPGLADFMAPPSIDQLRAQCGGPVVITFTSDKRCDALIVMPEGDRPVIHVPLTDLTQDELVDRMVTFTAARWIALSPDSGIPEIKRAERAMLEMLAWLWDTVTEPVLDALGYTSSAGPAGPRLWWYPAGGMAAVPLHAAGHHAEAGQPHARTVLDRVVSSYTVSLRALGRARSTVGGACTVGADRRHARHARGARASCGRSRGRPADPAAREVGRPCPAARRRHARLRAR